jgi:hypothetical protein
MYMKTVSAYWFWMSGGISGDGSRSWSQRHGSDSCLEFLRGSFGVVVEGLEVVVVDPDVDGDSGNFDGNEVSESKDEETEESELVS